MHSLEDLAKIALENSNLEIRPLDYKSGFKTFSEIKQGDTVYFLIDTCNILQEYGGTSMGFANHHYGLVICSRVIVSERWEWHNPRTDNGLLFDLRIDKPIMYKDECLFGPHINEYNLKTDNIIPVTKKMGETSCIRYNFGNLWISYTGYVFTTKEELESKIREITDVVESNLRKIKQSLTEL